MKLNIKLKRFVIFQLVTVTLIVILGLITYIFRDATGFGNLFGFLRLLDVGSEQSIPTYFSLINLLLSSILLYIIFKFEKSKNLKRANYWLFLSILFVFLSIDESASIHENFDLVYDYLSYNGFAPRLLETHQWLFFGLLFIFFIGIILIPFFKILPKRTLGYFLISGIIFVVGAMGFEFLGAIMLKTGIVESKDDLLFSIRRIFEEGFEMYGIALFNIALYREISNKKIALTIASS
ncbi:hypothetical protein BFR04_08515 [Gaetbulibacter sp. 4G1]|nr:hypothetical protein [Gaetbulibacter sp. 4G1]PIA77475.1 hypothetical protein BFR04_08515 [Gaetbulibacter sp. 4G1]